MVFERIQKLREREFETEPSICLERARMVTEFYSQASMEPFMLRRAKFYGIFWRIKRSILMMKRFWQETRVPGSVRVQCSQK